MYSIALLSVRPTDFIFILHYYYYYYLLIYLSTAHFIFS